MLHFDYLEGSSFTIGPVFYKEDGSDELKGPEYVTVKIFQNQQGHRKIGFDASKKIHVSKNKHLAKNIPNYSTRKMNTRSSNYK